ncbi:hypothetical protein Y032_0037g3533 [Ancylostoma ceylanicum]|uniref:Uncharacterized protein n=1 Tax=Ancylostoma ceylanicum TaxID=53326 RepID=A0A016ULR1_9BILA|nr:hypothetical protein Y032_0037g3533 [Ancylostoma ceylanicum]
MPGIIFVIVDPLFVISVRHFFAFLYSQFNLCFQGFFDIMTIIAQEWIRADFKLGFGTFYTDEESMLF